MSYFDELHDELKLYLDAHQIEKCYTAYLVAEKGHEGQMRRSGESYITHPVAAALILAQMRLDYQTIMATLLHDVVEDTKTSKQELIHQFGEEVLQNSPKLNLNHAQKPRLKIFVKWLWPWSKIFA